MEVEEIVQGEPELHDEIEESEQDSPISSPKPKKNLIYNLLISII